MAKPKKTPTTTKQLHLGHCPCNNSKDINAFFASSKRPRKLKRYLLENFCVMELLFELIYEIFFSLSAEFIGHIFLWFGFGDEPEKMVKKKSQSLIRGVITGFLLGIVSLTIVSHPILENVQLQLISLLLSSLFLGIWAMIMGILDRKYDKAPSPQDTFLYGASFGFIFSFTRLTYFYLYQV